MRNLSYKSRLVAFYLLFISVSGYSQKLKFEDRIDNFERNTAGFTYKEYVELGDRSLDKLVSMASLEMSLEDAENHAFISSQSYNSAIKINDEDISLRLGRGIAFFYSERFEESVQDLGFYCKVIGCSQFVQYIKGSGKREIGDFYGAERDLDLALDPAGDALGEIDLLIALENRGLACFKLKKYSKAKEDFDKYIDLEPASPNGYKYRAMIYFKTGLTAEGCKDLSSAYELGATDLLQHINKVCW